MIKTMPCAPLIMVVVLVTMIAFYATSFDSIALTASCYSYRKLEDGEEPAKGIQLMWCILLILLPIALLFAESSMNSLQSVSIVAAFPIGIVIVMIAVSFLKDAELYLEELQGGKAHGEEKKRIVKLTAFLFLLAASIFVMPQKAFADENEDVTLPTGDIKPMEPQQDESGIDTYGADEGDEFSGTEYELYTVLENRVKEAMLAGNEWVSIKDLKIRRDTYDLSFYYGYSPYFSSDTYNRIIAWYGDAYYTGLRITNTFGTPEETKQIFNAVDEKLASIYKLVNNSMTDEQKALVIHDYLVSHAEYDLNYKNYTSYGVLMDGRGVCQSYALAYMYILNHLGIENPPWLNGSVHMGILMDVPLAVLPILCYHKTRK